MDVKLIKVEDEFYNLVGKEDLELIASDDEAFQHNYKTGKLSTKNCQEIERGYDLDELSVEYASGFLKRPVILCTPLEVNTSEVVAFQKGFQKALELMGDKKFSEDDMKSFAQKYYREIRENTSNLLWTQLADKCLEEHIQSLQQTEWDVEIEVECVMGCQNFLLNGEKSVCCGDKKPKLDADGCLILKRK